MTTNTKLAQGFLASISKVTAHYTSQTYALIVIDSMLKDLQETYPFLKHIKVITSPYSGLESDFFIDPAIEDVGDEDLGAAFKALLDGLSKPIGAKTRDQFLLEINGYMGKSLERDLHHIGVSPFTE